MDTNETTQTTEASTPKVEIYSTESCHFCHLAKEWLTEKNIPYSDYNVGADMERRKEMVEMTGQMGVPVIKIGDEVMVGFNQEHMAKLLAVAE